MIRFAVCLFCLMAVNCRLTAGEDVVTGGITKDTPSFVATNSYLKKAYYEIESQWRSRLSASDWPRELVNMNIEVTFYSDGNAVGTPLGLQAVSSSSRLSTELALKAIDEASPFPPFPAAMRRELAQYQHGDENIFSERFYFTVPSRYER